jgi:hypothetical protein
MKNEQIQKRKVLRRQHIYELQCNKSWKDKEYNTEIKLLFIDYVINFTKMNSPNHVQKCNHNSKESLSKWYYSNRN